MFEMECESCGSAKVWDDSNLCYECLDKKTLPESTKESTEMEESINRLMTTIRAAARRYCEEDGPVHPPNFLYLKREVRHGKLIWRAQFINSSIRKPYETYKELAYDEEAATLYCAALAHKKHKINWSMLEYACHIICEYYADKFNKEHQ